MHIAVLNDEEVVVDGLTAEVAKTATKSKLYHDKLKLILATKCHINNFLASVPYIKADQIKKLKFPIIQIMGMNLHVYTLRLAYRGTYVLEDLCDFSFPTGFISLREEVEKMIDGLSMIEVSFNCL